MQNETLHHVAKAVELACGERPHPATWQRWIRKGLKGQRLKTMLVCGRRKTSVENVLQFFERVTAAADDPTQRSKQTTRQREAAIERAERELEQEGIA